MPFVDAKVLRHPLKVHDNSVVPPFGSAKAVVSPKDHRVRNSSLVRLVFEKCFATSVSYDPDWFSGVHTAGSDTSGIDRCYLDTGSGLSMISEEVVKGCKLPIPQDPAFGYATRTTVGGGSPWPAKAEILLSEFDDGIPRGF